MKVLFAVAMLVMVRAVALIVNDQSARLLIEEDVKVQGLAITATDVSPAVGEVRFPCTPERILTAAEAETSEPFVSIQRRLKALELLPNGVQKVAQFAIPGIMKTVLVTAAVLLELV